MGTNLQSSSNQSELKKPGSVARKNSLYRVGYMRYEGFRTHKKWKEYRREHPVRMRPNGILATVVSELRFAGQWGTPVPKEYLMKILRAKYPKRNIRRMHVYLNNCLPTRLRWMYHIEVQVSRLPDGRKGYCILPEKPKTERADT